MADDRLLVPAPETTAAWTRTALRGSPLVAALAQAVLDAHAKDAKVRRSGVRDDSSELRDGNAPKSAHGLILIHGGRNEEDSQ